MSEIIFVCNNVFNVSKTPGFGVADDLGFICCLVRGSDYCNLMIAGRQFTFDGSSLELLSLLLTFNTIYFR